MRGRTMHISAAILFFFLLCQTSIAGQKLRYKFEKGKSYTYSTSIESKTSGQAMGQEFTMTSGADIDYSFTSLGADAGTITLQVQYMKFNIKLNMPMMGYNDSTVVMKEYIGKRVKLVITDKGKTLSVEPIDTIPPSRIQMMTGLTPTDLFKQILLELPEQEVAVNDSWKKEIPDTMSRSGMKMIVKPHIECKIVGEEQKNNSNCWKITLSGTSTIEGSGSQRGADVTADGTVKISGNVFFAPVEGVSVVLEQTSDTDLTTTATGAQTGATTMTISTSVKSMLIK